MILIDSGFLVALASPRDAHHARCVAAAGRHREPWICTWPVLTETTYFLLSRLGPAAEAAFLRSVRDGALTVLDLRASHFGRLAQLVEKYADLPMDLADASLVVAAEDLGTGRILSTDQRDFQTYRWKSRQPFDNLLF